MNRVVLIGRLTREPDSRYTQGEEPFMITTYTLAVDRARKKEGEAEADFVRCVAFRRQGDFAAKYFRRGMKVAVSGRIQTGSYVNREGRKVYTTDVIVDDQEFAESRKAEEPVTPVPVDEDGFMYYPDEAMDDLPFS